MNRYERKRLTKYILKVMTKYNVDDVIDSITIDKNVSKSIRQNLIDKITAEAHLLPIASLDSNVEFLAPIPPFNVNDTFVKGLSRGDKSCYIANYATVASKVHKYGFGVYDILKDRIDGDKGTVASATIYLNSEASIMIEFGVDQDRSPISDANIRKIEETDYAITYKSCNSIEDIVLAIGDPEVASNSFYEDVMKMV